MPPGTPGKHRLARTLLGKRTDIREAVVRDRLGFIYLVPSIDEPIAFSLLIDGVYEPDTLRFICERLPGGGVFVDVGANVGVFSLPAAQRVGPEGQVIAVEASPNIFGYLRRNVITNNVMNVRLRHCAVTDGDTATVMFYDAPRAKFGMGSLVDRFGGPPAVIQARSLDQLLSDQIITRVDVLKVDVEGFEVAVFRGAERLLTGPTPPAVVFEFCDWAEASAPGCGVGAAQRLLLSWGYDIHRTADVAKNGAAPLRKPIESGFAMLVATRS